MLHRCWRSLPSSSIELKLPFLLKLCWVRGKEAADFWVWTWRFNYPSQEISSQPLPKLCPPWLCRQQHGLQSRHVGAWSLCGDGSETPHERKAKSLHGDTVIQLFVQSRASNQGRLKRAVLLKETTESPPEHRPLPGEMMMLNQCFMMPCVPVMVGACGLECSRILTQLYINCQIPQKQPSAKPSKTVGLHAPKLAFKVFWDEQASCSLRSGDCNNGKATMGTASIKRNHRYL